MAVFLAADASYGDIVKSLLKANADPHISAEGRMSLHTAAQASRLSLVKALLAGGSDAKLDVAAGSGLENAVRVLLEAGANVLVFE